jgi:hypothetical protein
VAQRILCAPGDNEVVGRPDTNVVKLILIVVLARDKVRVLRSVRVIGEPLQAPKGREERLVVIAAEPVPLLKVVLAVVALTGASAARQRAGRGPRLFHRAAHAVLILVLVLVLVLILVFPAVAVGHVVPVALELVGHNALRHKLRRTGWRRRVTGVGIRECVCVCLRDV